MAFVHIDANCAVVVVSTGSTGLYKQPGSHQDHPIELHALKLTQDFLSIPVEPTQMRDLLAYIAFNEYNFLHVPPNFNFGLFPIGSSCSVSKLWKLWFWGFFSIAIAN